ncbi:aminoglycoside phosphotransferase family protein [Actinoplanes sp. NPDC089786]|uniref:aminoglycoside phosphotransferase family protein n=1 Tax=Actinoplanes sp. NPDC089786 TaxID=3155185 RepID=UPI0034127198
MSVPVPKRDEVGEDQVRRLVAEQFPQWAGLPVTRVAASGWDNQTFHLGDRMSVRLPSAAEYAQAVAKEHRWLPALAPHLPLPIPTPLACGQPGAGYPFVWSVYGWVDGSPATADQIADPVRFATDLAGFLAALRAVDSDGGPRPGLHNWFRGGPLATYDEQTRDALTRLTGHIDVALARAVWTAALDATWDGVDRWFHGDVADGNLLQRDGQLAAVIDFGTCGVGDPACDLVVAWTLLTPEARSAFRSRLAADDAEWSRGRGWALWKALILLADNPADVGAARVLDEILRSTDRWSSRLGSRATSGSPPPSVP